MSAAANEKKDASDGWRIHYIIFSRRYVFNVLWRNLRIICTKIAEHHLLINNLCDRSFTVDKHGAIHRGIPLIPIICAGNGPSRMDAIFIHGFAKILCARREENPSLNGKKIPTQTNAQRGDQAFFREFISWIK
jgi:hypothetical protein